MEEAIVTCQFLEEMTGRLQKENNWNRRVKNLERRDETVLYESEFSWDLKKSFHISGITRTGGRIF